MGLQSCLALDCFRGTRSHFDDLRKNYRLRLYLMQYRGIQKWIWWQAKKHGLRVLYVSPSYSSTTCPKSGEKMKENKYKTLRYVECGYEEHGDYVAVFNLYGKGSLHLLTVHRMKGGKDHSYCENPCL